MHSLWAGELAGKDDDCVDSGDDSGMSIDHRGFVVLLLQGCVIEDF